MSISELDHKEDMYPCPRASAVRGHKEPHQREDGSCSYCGSLSVERFFKAIEESKELGPTDKDYKVYVNEAKTAQNPTGKFYFYHLNEEEMKRFVELFNAKKLKIGYPGHFYAMPFFMSYKSQ